MGVMALAGAPKTASGPRYGRWKFEKEKVVKWNCVYRVKDQDGVADGEYAFRHAVIVGDRETVRRAMVDLAQKQ
jgi:hypothetical protein